MPTRIRFLLGPAGSGKTRRCLEDIRLRLRESPEGPPLLLLAPKQATFQLERRLLEAPDLAGWSRLQILSFDRLARQILEAETPVELLSEEGRLMVLRAILRRNQDRLVIYRGAARQAGFAHELGTVLREFQRHQVGPDRLAALADHTADAPSLAGKLRDLSLLLRAYLDWLREHDVLDVDVLPDLAARALRRPRQTFALEAVWLDGFAEMTPQETNLLAAVVGHATEAFLTFCLTPESPAAGEIEAPSIPEAPSWLSTWAVVSRTLRACHTRLAALDDVVLATEFLPSAGQPDRFASSAPLAHLARHWSTLQPAPPEVGPAAADSILLRPCPDAEGEATSAAREIIRHVRAGGRYRDVAVLLRSLDPYHPILERVFRRYRIPCFVDRRESLAHHPLAEVTRSAIRLAAFQWQHEDWFAALKSSLAPATTAFVDTLENTALAKGWNGRFWPDHAESQEWTGDARAMLAACLTPFREFQRRLGTDPSARQLAAALRCLWDELRVREQLEAWLAKGTPAALRHRTAWEELLAWLENLELGFDEERFPLSEWLPILESGLSALTAGVIPPAQDQVLVGAIDRSRQPELRLALVLGVNEGVFPPPAASGGLLSEDERNRLLSHDIVLGPSQRHRIGHERYYGYIACTRAGQRLIVSWSQSTLDGKPALPSVFVAWLRALFPNLPESAPDLPLPALDSSAGDLETRSEHPIELVPWLLHRRSATPLDALAGDSLRRAWLRRFRSSTPDDRLTPDAVRALLGMHPEVSVSALERLAGCPFQHFVQHALRATERERFEINPRHSGSLSHAILAAFHASATAQGRRWRDLDPTEALRLLDAAAAELLPRFRDGLYQSTPEARWTAGRLVMSLRRCIATLVAWAPGYRLDPSAAELHFGTGATFPAWRVPLGPDATLRVRGTIDRLDGTPWVDDSGPAWYAVLDYKQHTPRFREPEAMAGIDLQLPVYLLAAREVVDWRRLGGGTAPKPAGMFFIGLGNRPPAGKSREPSGLDPSDHRRLYQHRGRFSAEALRALDPGIDSAPSGQFAAKLRKDGRLSAQSDGLEVDAFESLLDGVRNTVRQLGWRLQAGEVGVAPLRMGSWKACDGCDWGTVCRFDSRTDPYRTPTVPAESGPKE